MTAEKLAHLLTKVLPETEIVIIGSCNDDRYSVDYVESATRLLPNETPELRLFVS